jgi:sugar phosphate isomerase/epimerase
MSRLISLASGVLPEFTPSQTAAAAIDSGWPAVGIWVDPETWTDAIARDVGDRTRDAGVAILDVEVVWLQPGPDLDAHERILDAGAAIGARNVLVVSSDPDPASTAAKLGRLVDLGRDRGLRVCLELAAFTKVRSLAAALDILERTGRPDAALMIDPLHLARTGGLPADVHAVDPVRLPYAQFCDATAIGPDPGDVDAIIAEALDDRLSIGEGELPLRNWLDALPPDTPLSIELRSKALRDGYPDATDRAAALLASTRTALTGLEPQRQRKDRTR